MQIAIGNPIGYQSNMGGTAGIFDYLINDTFTTNRAAGAVNGTDAEPGPGRRTVTDTNGKLSLSGGAAVFATGGVGSGNPGIWYQDMARDPGRICLATITLSSNAIEVGFDSSRAGSISDAVRVVTSGISIRSNLVNVITVAPYDAVTYTVAVAMRYAGADFFIKAGTDNFRFLYSAEAGVHAVIAPAIGNQGTTSAGVLAFFRVPAARWLPTPLASDGFGSAFGSSDGLGHAEGVAGGVGAGGSGLAWTQHVGVWSAAGGVATSTLVAGRALASVDCGTADVFVSVKLAVGANSAAISARYVDESNRLELRHTGAAIQFVKVIAGVSTTLVSAASTFVPGAELRLSCIGTKFRVYYNNAFIGTEQTIADAAVATATRFGLRNADVTNTFDDFVVYAIGTGGEYAVLDTF